MLSKTEAAAFERPHGAVLAKRLAEPRRFLQVVAGPRQVGKTTLVRQVLARTGRPATLVSADEPTLRDRDWLVRHWREARELAAGAGRGGAVLALDEVQKIPGWSETVKRLWDEDTAAGVRLKVVVLGSAPLLLQRGLGESLAGRFETLHLPHWSFGEMKAAFGWTLDAYIVHGGYPGAAPLIADAARWRRYVLDALIETTISRDVLLLTRVDKPALLRRLFELACRHSGQILSFTKMLGQLQDAGNTVTLAHYLELLASAGMVTGLQKFAGDAARSRGSSPKLQVLNTALMSASSGLAPNELRADRELWGTWWSLPSARTWPTPQRRATASCSTGASATAKSTSSCAPGGGWWASRSRAAAAAARRPGCRRFPTASAAAARCWWAKTARRSKPSCRGRSPNGCAREPTRRGASRAGRAGLARGHRLAGSERRRDRPG